MMPGGKTRMLAALLGFAALAGTVGCATVLRGTTQKVRIVSHPPGATVTVGKHRVKTPATIRLRKSYSYVMSVRKAGYDPEYVYIHNQNLDDVIHGNWAFLIFFWLGYIVDGATGAGLALSPSKITVTLRKRAHGVPGLGDAGPPPGGGKGKGGAKPPPVTPLPRGKGGKGGGGPGLTPPPPPPPPRGGSGGPV